LLQLARELRRQRTAEKQAVQVRSLSSRREQVVLVRVLSVLLCNVVAVQLTLFVHAITHNAHLRR
jgi:hypothetical protein